MLLRLSRLFRLAGREVAVLWYACRNPATPLLIKVGAAILAFYMVSPIDFVPDALPVLGWLDDVTLLTFAIPALLKLIPEPVLNNARFSAEHALSKWTFWRRKA
jgi:uncharacterized membrane protein YkvA (DUF1232 family)